MKLIVTIPAYNEAETIADVIREIPRKMPGIDSVEVLVVDDGSRDETPDIARRAGADYVISNRLNRGLAATFKTALSEAVNRGADIIVNTDADNHYDQTRIPELVRPLLSRDADITIGSRLIDDLPMKPANKYGNKAANFIMQRLLKLPDVDVSTGFRAYTRDAALRLNVLSDHTYTHETLLNALDQHLRIYNVPIAARHVARPSRLIKGIASHVFRAGGVILRSFLLYRPLQVYGTLGALLFALGTIPFARFGYFVLDGSSGGHVQSLIIGAALWFLGGQMLITGMLAMAIAWNRRMTEEVLLRIKTERAAASEDARPALRVLRPAMEREQAERTEHAA
ncbi:MAG TPA: glycosyltransferase family 2 protein [Dehalococcoidia bacterium]|nr:glycosyltransferase family 2 protein [Dehalococcoidia bacterium]